MGTTQCSIKLCFYVYDFWHFLYKKINIKNNKLSGIDLGSHSLAWHVGEIGL